MNKPTEDESHEVFSEKGIVRKAQLLSNDPDATFPKKS